MSNLIQQLADDLTTAELTALVEQAITTTGATTKADMGKVMKPAQQLAAGRADGKTLSAAVSSRLS